MKRFFTILLTWILCSGTITNAQPVQSNPKAIPSPSASFLTFAPDARSAGMGEAGVALSPDANAAYWNASKLAFAEKEFGASLSYTPWLRNVANNRMWLGYASAYKKIGKGQALALSVNYFNHGIINVRTPTSLQNGSFTGLEYAVNGTYSRQLSRNFSMGFTLKYISSNLGAYSSLAHGVGNSSRTVAGDISAFYQKQYKNELIGKSLTWSMGAVLSNLGGKIASGMEQGDNFIPTSFKIGGGLSFTTDARNRFNFVLDAGKLMVPTPVNGYNSNTKPLFKGIFGSFSDAEGGLKEELQEIAIAVGGEYWYKNRFALRGGYFGENKNKGDRKFFSAGAGVNFLRNYNIDFSYLFPVAQGSPLAKTFRLSLAMYLDKKGGKIL